MSPRGVQIQPTSIQLLAEFGLHAHTFHVPQLHIEIQKLLHHLASDR